MENINEILSSASNHTLGVWLLIGVALVFFMQSGFAMVETGLTRAKNAGNVIMKTLLQFCISTIAFMFIGFGILMSENYVMGIIGQPDLTLFTDYIHFNWYGFILNLVFCATAATIVSGALAERAKFSAYCIYSAVMSLVIYPVSAGWVWNSSGWLAKLGYTDFAGSTVVHMVGGISAFIGAAILGPRIGKYVTDKKTGKKTARAIPGHSITLSALGIFILWFGWYGFNGAAAFDLDSLASIFVTTTIAPAVSTVVTMCYTWAKNKKTDVSMSLSGALAGLVAISAGCNQVDALGAAIVGIVSGFLVVIAVEFIDVKLHVDDPVGAVAVHGVNGMWGGLAVGLLSTDGGLFYGGGFKQFGIQILGVLAIAVWTTVTMTIVFTIIKKTNGLRVSREEEIMGLDLPEHGLVSAYADFAPAISSLNVDIADIPAATLPKNAVSVDDAIPVQVKSSDGMIASDSKITKIEIIFNQDKFDILKTAMMDIGITGMTVTNVLGCGIQKGKPEFYRGVPLEINLLPKVQVEIVVAKVPVKTVIETAKKVLYTGHIGDGKIFVYDVENVVKVRTGEEGYDALQDVE